MACASSGGPGLPRRGPACSISLVAAPAHLRVRSSVRAAAPLPCSAASRFRHRAACRPRRRASRPIARRASRGPAAALSRAPRRRSPSCSPRRVTFRAVVRRGLRLLGPSRRRWSRRHHPAEAADRLALAHEAARSELLGGLLVECSRVERRGDLVRERRTRPLAGLDGELHSLVRQLRHLVALLRGGVLERFPAAAREQLLLGSPQVLSRREQPPELLRAPARKLVQRPRGHGRLRSA